MSPEARALEYIFGTYMDWERIVAEKLIPPLPLEYHLRAMGLQHVANENYKFSVGQFVEKPNGYPFPGVIVSRFKALQYDKSMAERYVVNMFDMYEGEQTGLLHIFAPEQLKLLT